MTLESCHHQHPAAASCPLRVLWSGGLKCLRAAGRITEGGRGDDPSGDAGQDSPERSSVSV
jgi:hypothetical protein